MSASLRVCVNVEVLKLPSVSGRTSLSCHPGRSNAELWCARRRYVERGAADNLYLISFQAVCCCTLFFLMFFITFLSGLEYSESLIFVNVRVEIDFIVLKMKPNEYDLYI